MSITWLYGEGYNEMVAGVEVLWTGVAAPYIITKSYKIGSNILYIDCPKNNLNLRTCDGWSNYNGL